MNEYKLPKTWKHWLKTAGYTVERYKLRKGPPEGYHYNKRTGRFIRIIPHQNRMCICNGDMDRWANSVGAECEAPTSLQDFLVKEKALLRVPSQ